MDDAYEIKFKLGEKVNLLFFHKDLQGVITSIWITLKGIRYEVRYFWEGKAQEVYFYDWELGKIEEVKQ